MKKTWKRIKNWLIHKLGGFTADEISTRFGFAPPQTLNISEIGSEVRYTYPHKPPREWIEDNLLGELVKQIKPYVRWDARLIEDDMTLLVRASMRVVANNG